MLLAHLMTPCACHAIAVTAYNRALHPKEQVTLSGGPFSPYTTELAQASAAATDFFRGHLAPKGQRARH